MLRKIALLLTVLALLSFGFAASAQDMMDWTCGTVDGDVSAAITITGWEGPGEVDKFLLAFDEFFETYYPNVEQVLNTGVAWSDYWTTLPAQLAGGAEIDMAWMHDTRNDTFAENGWALNLDSYLVNLPDSWLAREVRGFPSRCLQLPGQPVRHPLRSGAGRPLRESRYL